MSDVVTKITVEQGTSLRLLTAGKYCDRDILVTATGEPAPPSDGKTRVFIELFDTSRSEVPLYIQQTVSEGVLIDWGDGSDQETISGVGKVNTTHVYTSPGEYVISLEPMNDCILGFGIGTGGATILGSASTYGGYYTAIAKKMIIGKNVDDLANYCLNLKGLIEIEIPETVLTIGDRVFAGCSALRSLSFPNKVKSITANCVYSCGNLLSVKLPDELESIATLAFFSCTSLTRIDVPALVTTIAARAFDTCRAVKEYHLFPEVPPSLEATTAFTGISADCIIYVPRGSLEAYQTATNWATYADYMQEEPE